MTTPFFISSKVSTRVYHFTGVVVRACVMDEKELEMLEKFLRTANLVHLRDKFVSEKVQEMLLCWNYSALVYLLELANGIAK